MHGLGAFVGDDALKVEHMTNRHIFRADTAATQNVTGVPGDVDSGTTVVPLCERHLGGTKLATVFETTELE